jgi:SAM-dependent methyltransferase
MPPLRHRLRRLLEPPLPLIPNAREHDVDAPLGRFNLYLGGANRRVPGYINLDIASVPGVDVQADAHHLPFGSDLFTRVECDAVLEHVTSPAGVMNEIRRVLAPGGFAHLVVPFCHPFHQYPRDFHRFSIDGLSLLAGDLEIIDRGWRTGPTATLLVFFLEYVKLWLPWKWWRVAVHGVLGWAFAPIRYLDLLLLRSPDAGRIGNHCYIWLRKRV